MKRHFLTFSLLLVLSGCQLPPERVPLRPLPEEGGVLPVPYAELLTRARYQVSLATEAFYLDRWGELEDAAKGLEQTARFLPKATEVPPKQKDALPVLSADLGKEAAKLRDAARQKQVKESNEALQQLHLKVRELRLD
jgi:hypothetical protein